MAALDGLRLIAALTVLSFHYTAINKTYWGNTAGDEFPTLSILTRYGYLGVNLFFIISGFVILMTAYGRTTSDFVASRFSRLFPAYWVAVVLTVVLQLFWDEGRNTSVYGSLMNLTMLQEAWDVTNVQGAFWTLWAELKFYLLIGIFIVVGMTRQRIIAFAFLWPVLAQVARATDADMLASLLVVSYAPYFASGMLLFLLHREGSDLLVWLGVAMNYILCLHQATNYAKNTAPNHSSLENSQLVTALIITAMFVAIYLASHGRLAQLSWGWLTVAGALTYPIYLVHGQLGFFLIETLHDRLNSYLLLALAVVATLGLAWLIHRFVERPFHEPMRNAIRRSLAKGTPVEE